MGEVPWPHAPTHRLAEHGTFMVTAATYGKAHHFRARQRLEVLERGLLKMLQKRGWQLHAWAAFSNHYHFRSRLWLLAPRLMLHAEGFGVRVAKLPLLDWIAGAERAALAHRRSHQSGSCATRTPKLRPCRDAQI
jgi:putative transposase